MRTQLTTFYRSCTIYVTSLLLLVTLVGSQVVSALEIDRSRAVEITSVVEAPEILHEANRVLELSAESTAPIYILINSPGGSVYAGLQFVNAMRVARARGVDLVCVVPGIAMSMAFQFLLECDRRYALAYSLLLWHPVRIQGMFTLTPSTARGLADSLYLTELDLLPAILGVLSDYGMPEKEILYHYEAETVWTAYGLAQQVPGFIEVVTEIPGIKSIWHVGRMTGKSGSEAVDPTTQIIREVDIRYGGDGEGGGEQQPQPSPSPSPDGPGPEGPRDCRSCHNRGPHQTGNRAPHGGK